MVLLIMSWENNDLIKDCPMGMTAIKLCPGVKFFLLVVHRGCTVIKFSCLKHYLYLYCEQLILALSQVQPSLEVQVSAMLTR